MPDFTKYPLDERILKVLKEIKFDVPTLIQELAIPKLIEGLDIIASAQTGTGKTAAFMLPILNVLANRPSKTGNGPYVLILVPTRELAIQVTDEAKKFSKYLPKIKTVCVYGGVPYPAQRRSLSSHYDILVATPGRLLDYMERGAINLSQVGILVLDEADRMLDMGFIEPVERIASAMPKNRQTLLFSATIDHKILPISKKLQRNPCEIKVETTQANKNNIEQRLYYVDNINHKIRILEHLLQVTDIHQTIVFTSTKNQANVLARQLYEKGYKSSALHGDMNQRQRTRTIEKMRGGGIHILVATDVAARGIDISSLTHVINFDLPHNPEDFIHRVGRTGRAGASGVAITFATYQEEGWVAKINRLIGLPLNLHTVIGMEPQHKNSSGSFAPSRRQSSNAARKPSRRPGNNGYKNRSKNKVIRTKPAYGTRKEA